jgi:mycothiol synthase
MRRAALEPLPPIELPDGYVLRPAGPDDLPALSRCLAAAFPEIDWSEEKTRQRLFDDASVKRVFAVLADDGTIAATASARREGRFPEAGYLHWVGTDPAHAGRGLGRLATLAVLREFVRIGLTQAVLETDDFRLPAIHVYRKLGFIPELSQESHAARWAALG